MGKKSFALGRSLSEILKDHEVSVDFQQNNQQLTQDNSQKIVEINIDLIDPNPFQPRKNFSDDELVELAETIEKHGLIQPISLRKIGDRYQIISGERRTRATKLLGLKTIKAQVYENLNDNAMAEWALIENIQRVDLNPVEIARSYAQLIDNHGYTHEDLSKVVGKSRSAITNTLRLLKLPETVQNFIEEGKINSGAARALCSDKIENVQELAERIINEGLNVRQIEAIIRGENTEQESTEYEPVVITPDESNNNEQTTQPTIEKKQKAELSADMKNFETKLETFFGTKVQLNPSAQTESKGTIVINYYSMDDLTRIQQIMENN